MTAPVFTMAVLKAFCRRHGWLGTLSDDDTQLGYWINSFEQFLAMERRWDWMEDVYRFNLTAPIIGTSGQVATGATTFIDNYGDPVLDDTVIGQELHVDDDEFHLYFISGFDTPSNYPAGLLTIDPAYLGAGGSELPFQIRYVRYALPADWGQEGDAYLDTGQELNLTSLERGEWERRRMWQRGTMSLPLSLSRCGDYLYCEGAPASARQVRCVYWKRPVWMTSDSDVSTFLRPEVFGLLAEALAVRLKAYDADAGLSALRERWYQEKIDLVYNARRRRGPIRVPDGPMPDRISPFGGLGQMLHIDEA